MAIAVTNIYDLQFIRYAGSDGSYVQTANIDASPTSPLSPNFDSQTWYDNKGLYPIGTLPSPFTGYYDGQNYTIDNLFINRITEDNIGLFGCVENAKIRNCHLVSPYIMGRRYVGALVGRTTGSNCLVENCHVRDCTVEGGYLVGGIVGWGFGTGVIHRRCSSTGSVLCTTNIPTPSTDGLGGGGLCCTLGDAVWEDSWSGCAVHVHFGGGGSCFGNVTDNARVARCYGYGPVTAEPGAVMIGGLIGASTDGNPTVEQSYWDRETTGQTTDALLSESCGLTTAEMKDKDSYVGWDFNRLWDIDPEVNNGYPFLNPRGGCFALTGFRFDPLVKRFGVGVGSRFGEIFKRRL